MHRMVDMKYNLDGLYLWQIWRELKDVQWMEKILETVLNDPVANWDIGGTNIERSLPRNVPQPWARPFR